MYRFNISYLKSNHLNMACVNKINTYEYSNQTVAKKVLEIFKIFTFYIQALVLVLVLVNSKNIVRVRKPARAFDDASDGVMLSASKFIYYSFKQYIEMFRFHSFRYRSAVLETLNRKTND